MEAELEAERQGAEEEQQRAREAIEQQKAELQKLEEQRRAKVCATPETGGSMVQQVFVLGDEPCGAHDTPFLPYIHIYGGK